MTMSANRNLTGKYCGNVAYLLKVQQACTISFQLMYSHWRTVQVIWWHRGI